MTNDERHRDRACPPAAWRYGYVSERELRPRKSRRRATSSHTQSKPGRRTSRGIDRRGVALVVVITAITIISVFVADLIENTTTEFHVAESQRDRLKAEYLAKSGLSLVRLLLGHELEIRKVVAPIYQVMVGRAPPQLNVWDFSESLLAPFANLKSAEEVGRESGIDFGVMQGVKDTGGSFSVITVPENSKINLNSPLFYGNDVAKNSVAMQLYALMDGSSLESPYDPMFSARDSDGHFSSRLDIVSAVIDWWDSDDQRTSFDPGAKVVASAGSEDDIYSQLPDPYSVKNAPFDSLQELRMVRGIGDDFWATFIEDQSGDPRNRKVTIYGSGAVNVNNAPPEVLLARICSYVAEQPLCQQTPQQIAFVQMFNAVRSMLPIALFSNGQDFFNFISGKPIGGKLDMYTLLVSFLGKDSPLMAWTPLVFSPELQKQLAPMFLTEASIFSLQSTGTVGRTQVKLSMVMNNDRAWVPPKGVAATMPTLGVVHYYHIE